LSNFSNSTIGAFAQYSWHLLENSTIEAGIRGDHTEHWGDEALPRIALFHRFNSIWAVRAGAALGYKTPNALEPQTVDYAVKNIQDLPENIKPEKSVGYNLEGNFKKQLGSGVSIFINHAFFYTEITDPVISNRLPNGDVLFGNANGNVITKGFDTYIKMMVKKTEIYFGYTYTDAERKYLPENQFMPLTPQNRFAFTAVREFAEKWKIGLEGSWTGQQTRDGDNNTPSWFFSAIMIERKFGKLITAVLNFENLFDYRQSRQEQMYTGSISNPEFKPLWAPADGRVVNLSFRFTPFKK
jgi:iron complex outermembrane receptor protein/outer membrane receptor for ferrienterochelin and colicins